jgi:hypothetical protein
MHFGTYWVCRLVPKQVQWQSAPNSYGDIS